MSKVEEDTVRGRSVSVTLMSAPKAGLSKVHIPVDVRYVLAIQPKSAPAEIESAAPAPTPFLIEPR